MNEWLKKVIEQVKTLWKKITTIQKIIVFSIIGVLIVAFILFMGISSSPGTVRLYTSPITDEQERTRISARLDDSSVSHNVTEAGIITVDDEKTAKRMRAILASEGYLPASTSPWDAFNMDRWTMTDFERNVNLQRAIEQNIEQYIETLDDIDNAEATLTIPEKTLFSEDQDPNTASIIITVKPGSDFVERRNKVEGLQRLVKLAVGGSISDENIVISDSTGIVLNDFSRYADFDLLELSRRQIEQKKAVENSYRSQIEKLLAPIFKADRISVTKVDIIMDFSKIVTETTEHTPIITVPDNPITRMNEREFVLSIPVSSENVEEHFRGTGINPEGPPGQESQTPPVYKDLSNLNGTYDKSSSIVNNGVNSKNTLEEKSPWVFDRITVGIAIDGVWKTRYNEKGVVEQNPDGSLIRDYTPVPDEQLKSALNLVKESIGFNDYRGDSVTVEHLSFDRSVQFQEEDQSYRNKKVLADTILISIISIGAIIIAFIVFRLISREMERRRRLREEELSRQHQAMREAALRSAEEEGVDVQMSVEERARMEMQENAINMAREHPEDVAQLIRTWLVEE